MAIIVMGSLNTDMVIDTPRLPKVGETLMGSEINYLTGGKGANQAVAAARFGGVVEMVGRVGSDTFGQKLTERLAKEGVGIEQVKIEEASFTGMAAIFKLPTDNAIVVIPGTNDLVTGADLPLAFCRPENLLVMQLEIPIETVASGLQQAKQYGMQTILNPAPYHQGATDLLDYVDYMTPNETEFALMIGKEEKGVDVEAEMLRWARQFKTQLVVTRGSKGASFVQEGQVVTIPALKTAVVDTTGAGDTFNGVFATCLNEGESMEKAVRMATRGASLSVGALGAQTGMPTRSEILASF